MKTDLSIYEFLATGAEAFRVLSDGLTLAGPYRFVSLALKGIERRLDGASTSPRTTTGRSTSSSFPPRPWRRTRWLS